MTQDMGGEAAAADDAGAGSSEITARFLTEELAGILTAAEESAARIVERAQASTEQQIAEANRLWREVQGEIARFAAWRQEVEPIIEQVRDKVGEVREKVEAVPERIREALAPMADAISSVDADLAELVAAAPPPLLMAPAPLEAESEAWGTAAEELAEAGDDDA
jgi:septal ring factor EnvC (AmiA/AmiB activator)